MEREKDGKEERDLSNTNSESNMTDNMSVILNSLDNKV